MAENRPERLKAALQENLKRRKAQARGRDGKPAGEGAAEPEPHAAGRTRPAPDGTKLRRNCPAEPVRARGSRGS